MMKELYRIKPIQFLLWWTACSIFMWPLTAVVIGVAIIPLMIIGPALPDEILFASGILGFVITGIGIMLLGAVIGFTMAGLQRWLLRSKLYWAADGWRRMSMLGGAIGGMSVGIAGWLIEENISWQYSEDWLLMVAMPLFVLVVSALQWVALRQAVRQAWLWVMGNAIAGLVFSALLVRNPSLADDAMLVPLFGLAVIAQGFITGYVMLFLFEKKLLPLVPEGEDDILDEPDRPKSVWDEAI